MALNGRPEPMSLPINDLSQSIPLKNYLEATNDVNGNNNAAAAEDQVFDEVFEKLKLKNVTTDEENLDHQNKTLSETTENTKAIETGIILLIDHVAAVIFCEISKGL